MIIELTVIESLQKKVLKSVQSVNIKYNMADYLTRMSTL